MIQKNRSIIDSSFRDPNGFLFFEDHHLYRQINIPYKDTYDLLMRSGLYDALVTDGLLVPHKEMPEDFRQFENGYKVIRPEKLPFISYPYEWCFSQLKDAALCTLTIQKKAFTYGMTLKDSSAYNIQFINNTPVMIDTLSFERYQEGSPWIAYKQFCQHFLAPLLLMRYKDIRLNQFSKLYIDGIPLDLASLLLPKKTYLNFGILSHIHLHAKSQSYFADKKIKIDSNKQKMGKIAFQGLIDNLESITKKLNWNLKKTEWGDYYNDTNYSSHSFTRKKEIISRFIDRIKPEIVWDLGANTGVFSRIPSEKGIFTVSFDIDPVAVEKNYRKIKDCSENNLLPLILDLTNPSPSIGWAHKERSSFMNRGPADMVLALALIHHLAISNNVPLGKIAKFFSDICKTLIIEFVPKNDSQVQRLLASREDIFTHYTKEAFEKEFMHYFSIEEQSQLQDSERIMYLMKLKV